MATLSFENKKWLFPVNFPIHPYPPPFIYEPNFSVPKNLEDNPNGPGTILHKMLGKIGIHSTPNCSCRRRAIEMNERGPNWCEENIDIIVGWLREEATKRKLPFIDFAGKLLIQRAIKISKKNLKN